MRFPFSKIILGAVLFSLAAGSASALAPLGMRERAAPAARHGQGAGDRDFSKFLSGSGVEERFSLRRFFYNNSIAATWAVGIAAGTAVWFLVEPAARWIGVAGPIGAVDRAFLPVMAGLHAAVRAYTGMLDFQLRLALKLTDQDARERIDRIESALRRPLTRAERRSAEWYGLFRYADSMRPFRDETIDISMNEGIPVRDKLRALIGSRHRGGKILSVGVGSGLLEQGLAAHYGMSVHGVDLMPELVDRARNKGINARIASGENLPYSTGEFDAVILSESLGHMDPARALEEARRVLKPGGDVYIMDYTGMNPVLQLIGYRARSLSAILRLCARAGLENPERLTVKNLRHPQYVLVHARKTENAERCARDTCHLLSTGL